MNFEHEKTRGLSLAWYGVCIISELLFSIDKGNQAANGSRQAQRLNSHPGHRTRFRHGKGPGIDHGQLYGQGISGNCPRKCRLREQLKALRCFYLCQAVVDAGMQAIPLENTVLTAGQRAIRQVLRRAATFCDGRGILNGLPGAFVLAPFQQECGSGQRTSGGIHLFDSDCARTQGIDEGHLHCLPLD